MSALAVAAAVIAVAVSTALLVLVVALVWWLDRYDREPLQLVVGVFVWGAAVAPLLGLAGATVVGSVLRHPIEAVLASAALEEALKAAAVVLVARYSADFDTPTDGLVYGTAAGLGFAAAENILHLAAGAVPLSAAGVLGVVLQRTLLAAGVHGLASGVVGGFVGVAYLSRGAAARAGWTLCGLAVGTALHGGWNLAVADAADRMWWPMMVSLPVLYLLYLGAFAAILRWEHTILRAQLQDEATLRLVPPWVPEVIPFYRRRVRSDWWPRRSERAVLSRLLTRLAFRKYQTSRLPAAEAAIASWEIVHLRTRVRRMLGPTVQPPDEENVKPL